MKNLGRSLAVLAAAAALLVSCGDSALVSLKTDALQVVALVLHDAGSEVDQESAESKHP